MKLKNYQQYSTPLEQVAEWKWRNGASSLPYLAIKEDVHIYRNRKENIPEVSPWTSTTQKVKSYLKWLGTYISTVNVHVDYHSEPDTQLLLFLLRLTEVCNSQKIMARQHKKNPKQLGVQIPVVTGMENFSTETGDWAWQIIQYLRVDIECQVVSLHILATRIFLRESIKVAGALLCVLWYCQVSDSLHMEICFENARISNCTILYFLKKRIHA